MPHEVTGAAASAGCVLDEGASHANAGAPYLVTRGLVKGYGEGAARMEVLTSKSHAARFACCSVLRARANRRF